eukprot:snap_masked-scaffold_10-processed-gene-13.25-mRNA-1 protein AED:1.00 eAED:1.00 QI:0/-1/0/0/-1/1/1/0/87
MIAKTGRSLSTLRKDSTNSLKNKIDNLENMNFNLQDGDINVCELAKQRIQAFCEQETMDTQLDTARETTVLEPGTPQYLWNKHFSKT